MKIDRDFKLNGNQLKLIAVVTMLLDHIGYLLVGKGFAMQDMEASGPCGGWWALYSALRMVGRAAFPIFCFLLVEGIMHTGDWRKYALRLGVFAVVSEVPFDLMESGKMVDPSVQNVFFTLLLGLLMIKCLEVIEGWLTSGFGSGGGVGKKAVPMETGFLLQLGVIIVFCGAAWLLRTDYDYIGIMLAALFYFFRREPVKRCVLGFAWMAAMLPRLVLIPGLILGFLAIYLYNGQRGKWKGKYFFYLFYPVHMIILVWIYSVIFGYVALFVF